MASKKAPKTYTLKVRLSAHEQAKLEAYALKHDLTLSRIIREYIRRLPNPPSGQEQVSQQTSTDVYSDTSEIIRNKKAKNNAVKWFEELKQPTDLVAGHEQDELDSDYQQVVEEDFFSFWVEVDTSLKDTPKDLDEAILGLNCLHDGWDDSTVPGEVFKIYIASKESDAQAAITQAQDRGIDAGMYED